MQPLDLHVEHGGRIYDEAVVPGDISREPGLVAELYLFQSVEDGLVIGILHQLLELVGVLHESVADELLEVVRQKGIGLSEPSPVGDAVGDACELGVVHGVVVVEHVLHQYVRVEPGHAVGHVAAGEAEISHPDFAAGDDLHVLPLSGIVGVEDRDLLHKSAVDLLDYGVEPGQQRLEQVAGPVLKSFGHDRVVGIGECPAGEVPGLVPAESALVHEQSHELRHTEGRVSVVDMYRHLVGQIVQCLVLAQMLRQDALQGSRHEEVLLLQPELLSRDMVVGRIEHL